MFAWIPLMCSYLPSSSTFYGPFTFSPLICTNSLPFSSQNVRDSRYSCSPRTLIATFFISTSFGNTNDSLSFILSPSWIVVVPLLNAKRSEHMVSIVVHSTFVIRTSLRIDSYSNCSIPDDFNDSYRGQMELLTTTRWLCGAPNIFSSFRSSLTACW